MAFVDFSTGSPTAYLGQTPPPSFATFQSLQRPATPVVAAGMYLTATSAGTPNTVLSSGGGASCGGFDEYHDDSYFLPAYEGSPYLRVANGNPSTGSVATMSQLGSRRGSLSTLFHSCDSMAALQEEELAAATSQQASRPRPAVTKQGVRTHQREWNVCVRFTSKTGPVSPSPTPTTQVSAGEAVASIAATPKSPALEARRAPVPSFMRSKKRVDGASEAAGIAATPVMPTVSATRPPLAPVIGMPPLAPSPLDLVDGGSPMRLATATSPSLEARSSSKSPSGAAASPALPRTYTHDPYSAQVFYC